MSANVRSKQESCSISILCSYFSELGDRLKRWSIWIEPIYDQQSNGMHRTSIQNTQNNMMAQVSREVNSSPARPVTSLGIYSTNHLDEQAKGVSHSANSAKSIKQFLMNGQNYNQEQNDFVNQSIDARDCLNHLNCQNGLNGQIKKSISILGVKKRKTVTEQELNKDESVIRSNTDSLDMEYPYIQSLNPKHREYQVIVNKYKSNIQYLQTQLKQIYNIHVQNCILEENREIRAQILKLETQIRKIKLEVNDYKNIKSKAAANQAKIEELRYLITNQKKILNKLSIRELQLQDCLGRDRMDKKEYHEIYQEVSLEDIEDISNLQQNDNKIKIEAIDRKNARSSRYQKEMAKLTDISESITSNFYKMRDSAVPSATEISDILNNSAFMLKNLSYDSDTNLFEKQQECTSATIKDNKNEEQHKNILKERVRILKQSIMSRSQDFIRRIELLKKQKICLKKIIQIFKVNTINIDNEQRRLKKIILRQKSQSIFRSRLKKFQKVITPNKSQKNFYFAFRDQQSNSRQHSFSKSIKNLIYEDAWKQYQISTDRWTKVGNTRSQQKAKKMKTLQTLTSHKKISNLNRNIYLNKDRNAGNQFHEQYYSIRLVD